MGQGALSGALRAENRPATYVVPMVVMVVGVVSGGALEQLLCDADGGDDGGCDARVIM